MVALLLLFLTIPVAVFTKDVKCPDGFLHFKRTPTAKNNHTKDWCMKVSVYENVGNRDNARSVCLDDNATLTIPENREEYEAISAYIRKANISEPHAIDGQMSQRCKLKIFRHQLLRLKINTTAWPGDCNIKKKLFSFDDANTDTTFALSQFANSIPNGQGYFQHNSDPQLFWVDECMKMISTTDTGNRTAIKFADVSWCMGAGADESDKSKFINSVLCGRRPL
ncbi:hypothetical protein GCK72_004470 [Caenorhabditis remanei]|uniref:C-type lectin domain-containing protein n=1 Tax=Caenorhabditis remanei TaxID=31234 RepID=A0A6A5HDY8_CAERE|nr:hypothetical protein GCK72_004470 [Caenorhabditis remanei]KAF1764522.1 hypothetical protein GCK72_004470 [Caenorhabditis remanei]